ncbi:hypothetical protein [Roseateles asaccharophilus]|uniref:Uncharacterized protein YceK n=1 Tax=Roseateles asaccharophilus TaxID=582607 RepID=A0ABU2A1D7_9BURK|nr:hypothetical protein [Roseateles asaccharophilus]MDR7331004.1 uncharacterized protein YceK [Roseateles asaccharophilus]
MRHALIASTALTLLLAGCASVRDGRDARGGESRMAQAPSVAGVAQETFGKPAWGRQGEFTLGGQRVRYERGASAVSLFQPLAPGVSAPLSFTAGDSAARCEGWTPAQSANGKQTDSKPWVLSCKWGSAPAAMLQIGEGQLRAGLLGREGAYRRGDLTLGLRSTHLLEGSSSPRPAAVGYEMLHQGTVVGSLDLSGPVPRLRRPDPATPLGRAVTEAAVALALVSEPG